MSSVDGVPAFHVGEVAEVTGSIPSVDGPRVPAGVHIVIDSVTTDDDGTPVYWGWLQGADLLVAAVNRPGQVELQRPQRREEE